MIDNLSQLNSLMDYKPILNSFIHSGGLSELCRASLLITFLCSTLYLAEEFILNKGALQPFLSLKKIWIHVLILVLFFGIPTVYQTFFNAVLNGVKGLNDWAFAHSLEQFRADFRFALSTIAGHAPDGINFFSVPSFTAPVDILLLNVSVNIVLCLFYALVSYPPLFVVIAILSGPVLVPLSLLTPFRDMGERWGKFALAAAMFPFFTGMGLMALVDSAFFKAFATQGWDGIILTAILCLVASIAMMIAIPVVVAFLFASPAFAVLGYVFAVGSFFMGLFPVASQTFSLLRSLKKKKGAT